MPQHNGRAVTASPLAPPREQPRRSLPPTRHAAASSRPPRPAEFPPSFPETSFLSPSVLVQELPHLGELHFRSLPRRQSADQERLGRPAECALEQISGKLLLCAFARARGFVNVRALGLVAA